MNIRSRKRSKPEVGVLLSPLIDCVFLLLIFFLVTSMIKRYERQIPVTLADNTSSITVDPNDDAYPIGVSKSGQLAGLSHQNVYGVKAFLPLENPNAFLHNLIAERGPDAPIVVLVERGTTFQKVIRVQDDLELVGFEKIHFRIRDFPLHQTEDYTRR
jgi:biopolymer transport protein ExbD